MAWLLDPRPASGATLPTVQDLQIVGRVLGFQQVPATGVVIMAVVYDPSNAASRSEAEAIAKLLQGGLHVGGIELRGVLVDQNHLQAPGDYAAVFETGNVDDKLLAAMLHLRKLPCLTTHLDAVEHGSCAVAICSEPAVVIVVNRTNAEDAGVHFATAFRMMVREI